MVVVSLAVQGHRALDSVVFQMPSFVVLCTFSFAKHPIGSYLWPLELKGRWDLLPMHHKPETYRTLQHSNLPPSSPSAP